MPTLASFPAMATKTVDYLQSTLHPTQTPLAYVGGWLGRANLGDEALLAATRVLFPGYSLWHYDGSRTVSTLLRAIPRTSSGLFAGGTLINRTSEYLELAQSFVARGRRLHFFGTGVADPAFWHGRGDFVDRLGDWKSLLNDCGPIGVRGPRSAELLTDAGVAHVRVVGDPVLAFADEQPPAPVDDRWLGLNIGFDHGQQWGNPADVKREMLALARLAVADGWRVKWFVVFPGDLPLTRELARATGTEPDIVCAFHQAEAFLREVRSMALFVGMKLHATILALCASVPSLMLEYDPKCADFMRSIGREAALIRTDRFAAGPTWERLRDLGSHRNVHALALHRTLHALQRRQREFAADLARTLALEN